MNKQKLGIIMGKGDLPILLVEACKREGQPYFLLPIESQADKGFLTNHPHQWISFGKINKTLTLLKEKEIKELVFCGTVSRPSLFSIKFDLKGLLWLFCIGFKALGDDGLLSGIAELLEKEGFKVVGPHQLMKELLMPKGLLGKINLTKEDRKSIQVGFEEAKQLGKKDVGQGVIVESGHVIATETISGTEAMICQTSKKLQKEKRAILVKVSKPQQEQRMDLPTIGLKTIESLANYGYKGVALEAAAGLILNQKDVINLANKKGLFVYGVTEKDF